EPNLLGVAYCRHCWHRSGLRCPTDRHLGRRDVWSRLMAGDLHDAGVVVDPLFVALTRPAMRWGVTFSALLMNLVFTMEAFLLTKNLLTLLIAVPIHGVCALLCLRDPRFF